MALPAFFFFCRLLIAASCAGVGAIMAVFGRSASTSGVRAFCVKSNCCSKLPRIFAFSAQWEKRGNHSFLKKLQGALSLLTISCGYQPSAVE